MVSVGEDTARTRQKRGIIVVVVLGGVFFFLLALLLLSGKKNADTPGPRAPEALTVLPPTIRLRAEPNAKAAVVGTALAGEKLVKIEDRGAWVHVRNADGVAGWAERSLVERSAERERRIEKFAAIRRLPPLRGVVLEQTSLFAGPGIFYPVVGELPAGGNVQVFTRDHDFYAIAVGNTIAYAEVDSIDVTAGGESLAVKAQPDEAPSKEEEPIPEPEEIPEPQPVVNESPEPPTGDPSRAVYPAVPPGGTQPIVVERQLPRYPPAARNAGIGGTVVLRGIVRRDGSIDNVEVIREPGRGMLGEAARRAVLEWRFKPATFRGEPIDVYYTVTVNFNLR